MKKSKKIAISIALLSAMLTTAFAVDEYIGYLDYWNVDIADTLTAMFRMSVYPKVAESTIGYNMFTPARITEYTDYAVDEWTSEGMEMEVVSNFINANVLIYAGSYDMMLTIDPDLTKLLPGHTYRTAKVYEGAWNYLGMDVAGYKNTKSKIVAVWDNGYGTPILQSEVVYKNVILHEIGHALGWHGHSATTTDVMHKAANRNNISLTTRDVQHVKQVKAY